MLSLIVTVYHAGFLLLFLYLGVCRFLHTAPVSCNEVLRDVLWGFHSIAGCVISVPTNCEFSSCWCFDVIEDSINDILVLCRCSCIVLWCCVRRYNLVAAVGNRLQPRSLGISFCASIWCWILADCAGVVVTRSIDSVFGIRFQSIVTVPDVGDKTS